MLSAWARLMLKKTRVLRFPNNKNQQRRVCPKIGDPIPFNPSHDQLMVSQAMGFRENVKDI